MEDMAYGCQRSNEETRRVSWEIELTRPGSDPLTDILNWYL